MGEGIIHNTFIDIMKDDRLVKLSIKVQYKQDLAGDMFEGFPPGMSLEHIADIVRDRKTW